MLIRVDTRLAIPKASSLDCRQQFIQPLIPAEGRTGLDAGPGPEPIRNTQLKSRGRKTSDVRSAILIDQPEI